MINDAPLHMDEASRMERLYRHLLGMGLVVDPIFDGAGGARIAFRVSVGLPHQASEQAPEARVLLPMKGAQIGQLVSSSQEGRGNVVDFPTELR
jgi:hypothetical protein